MRFLPSVLITLPLLAAPLLGFASHPAEAREVAAEQAVSILARAQSADRHCRFLTPQLHQELSHYTARAEVAAASQISTGAASAAKAQGTAEGRKATCNDLTRTDIEDTLSAAREAVRAADRGRRARPARVREAAIAVPKAQVPRGKAGSLGLYSKIVEAYYLERKCRYLSPSQDQRYWKSVESLHRATVAANGGGAVAPVMRKAEARAGATACSAGLQTVKAGFAAAVRQ